jgi:protein-tyrosine phosphatase
MREDLRRFDYLIAMDDEHLEALQRLGDCDCVVARLLDFAPNQPIREVPDPYYDNTFPQVYDLVTAGAKGLLDHIRKEHAL